MIWNQSNSKAKATGTASVIPPLSWVPGEATALRDARLVALAELTQTASQGEEPQQLIEYVAETVADQLAARFVGIATWEDRTGSLIFRGGRGWPAAFGAGMKIPALPGSLSQTLFTSGKTIVIEDLRSERRFKPPRGLLAQGAISGMIAPVAQDARPFGLIGAFSSTRRNFSTADFEFFQAVANILSGALENDRLREKLRLSAEAARREATLRTAFIANASHEIRSPLNVILGYWELISERLGEVGEPGVTAWIDAV